MGRRNGKYKRFIRYSFYSTYNSFFFSNLCEGFFFTIMWRTLIQSFAEVWFLRHQRQPYKSIWLCIGQRGLCVGAVQKSPKAGYTFLSLPTWQWNVFGTPAVRMVHIGFLMKNEIKFGRIFQSTSERYFISSKGYACWLQQSLIFVAVQSL